MANDKREQAYKKFEDEHWPELGGDNGHTCSQCDSWAAAFLSGYDAGYAAATAEGIPQPWVAIDVLLWCPQCFEQHVDEAEPSVCQDCGHYDIRHKNGDGHCVMFHQDMSEPSCECPKFNPWLNPSHKSHRCGSCNHVWRPADVPTNGVLKLETQGKADGSAKPVAFANGKDFDDAVAIASGIPQPWVDVADRLPEIRFVADVTVQDEHDANDPPTFDYWIEREVEFRGDHWLIRDDGHRRQNYRYELDEVIAWRERQKPYQRQSREGDSNER